MEYALIVNSVVTNIICLHPINLGEFPNAVPTNGLSVRIGDTYDGYKFYHNGVEVRPNPYIDEPYGISPELTNKIKDDAITEVEEAVTNGTDE